MKKRATIAWALLVVSVLASGPGCTEEDGAMRCLPGAVSACPCVGGGEGVQTCLPSGLGLGPCECGVEPDVVSDTTSDASDTSAPDSDDADDTVDTGEHDLGGDTAGPDDGTDSNDAETDTGDGTTTPDTTATCPTAVIRVAEGDEVLPGTLLHLDGGDSIGSVNGAVTAWQWSIVHAPAPRPAFLPSFSVRNPIVEVNVVGDYTFRLEVFDAAGTKSCVAAEYVVRVVAAFDGIRVELTWDTPGDPDETDTGGGSNSSAGSDVDLHFLHPNAEGEYFDWTWDCYWENTNPEWGVFGPDDNPRMVRDDTDGGGPELIELTAPEDGKRYQVGTHYWDDWGYGDASATIRVYIRGTLADEWSDVVLSKNDLWDSHTIDWPSGTVTRITGEGEAPVIRSDVTPPGGMPF